MLAECYERAKQVLREHRDRMDQLVAALLDQNTVSRKEFVALMETGTIPEGLDDDKPQPEAPIPHEEKKVPETDGEKHEIPEHVMSFSNLSGDD